MLNSVCVLSSKLIQSVSKKSLSTLIRRLRILRNLRNIGVLLTSPVVFFTVFQFSFASILHGKLVQSISWKSAHFLTKIQFHQNQKAIKFIQFWHDFGNSKIASYWLVLVKKWITTASDQFCSNSFGFRDFCKFLKTPFSRNPCHLKHWMSPKFGTKLRIESKKPAQFFAEKMVAWTNPWQKNW